MGALTSKSYTFQARVWEISSYELIDTSDSILVTILANFRGTEFLRILPKVLPGSFVFTEWITDRSRFSYYSYKYQRFTRPLYRSRLSFDFVPVSWRFALSAVVLHLSRPQIRQNFYLNTRLDLESCCSLQSLFCFLKPYHYHCYTTFFFQNFQKGFDSLDFSINLSTTYFSSFDSVCFFGYDFNSALPLLDFEFSRNFFVSGCDVFTFGSNSSFLNYPVTNLGLSNFRFLHFLRGKTRFSRFISKKSNFKIYFSLNTFGPFAQLVFLFLKNFLSKSLRISYSFNLSQTVISPFSTSINFFSVFDSFSSTLFSDASRFKKTLHYFVGYFPSLPLALHSEDFVIYQGSNYSELVRFSNLVLPSLFPLEEKSVNLSLFGTKKTSHGLPFLPEFRYCWSNLDIFNNLISIFSGFQNSSSFSFSRSTHVYAPSANFPSFFYSQPPYFRFSLSSAFSLTSPTFFFYTDLLSQLSAPLALQTKLNLKLRSYLSFY